MKIPDKLKVGGMTYDVELSNHLYMGAQHYGGEIIYTDLKIRVMSNLPPDQQEHFFLHEMVHAIKDHLGYKDHDEKEVDELAGALHMIIKDNPSIFELIDPLVPKLLSEISQLKYKLNAVNEAANVVLMNPTECKDCKQGERYFNGEKEICNEHNKTHLSKEE